LGLNCIELPTLMLNMTDEFSLRPLPILGDK
jgi:hypothetical protein